MTTTQQRDVLALDDPGWTLPDAAARRASLPLTEVTVDDPFWNPYLERMRAVTLPTQLQQMKDAGYLDALRLDWQPGQPHRPHIFWESDLAKWVEAVSCWLATGDDPELEAELDEVIALLAGAQRSDGYLNAYYTVVEPGRRFTDHQDGHELYCAGHLIEAAVAHHEATGKTTLLEVACRYADLLVERFGVGGPDEGGYDGHPEIELALVRLHQATGRERYLRLAVRLVDNRGRQPFFFARQTAERGDDGYFGASFPGRAEDPWRWASYQQSHAPVRDQDEAVGHAVRAAYLYTGAAGVALETEDAGLWAAVGRLWDSVTERKMYVTGGIGDEPRIEGFGASYHLPNAEAYAETCAAIGLARWAALLGNATADARFYDVTERALYNGIASGTALDGRHYFYANPLSSDGTVERQSWFGTSCCPPNLARLLSALGTLVYARSADTLAVNLYVGSRVRTTVAGGELRLRQSTRFPVDGRVELIVEQAPPTPIRLALRLPGWAHHHALRLNGSVVGVTPRDGQLVLERAWQPGDTVQLDVPLVPRRVYSHPAATHDLGRVALQRGPVVYCVEEVDHAVPTSALALPREATLHEARSSWSALPVLTAEGTASGSASGTGRPAPLYSDVPPARTTAALTATPYAWWGNRGLGSMDVWIREEVSDPPAAGTATPDDATGRGVA